MTTEGGQNVSIRIALENIPNEVGSEHRIAGYTAECRLSPILCLPSGQPECAS